MVVVATEQLSAVVGVPKFTPVAEQPVLVKVVIFAGQVIVGTVLSVTVTVNEQVDELAGVALSVAVYVTVVVPTGNVAPGAKLLVIVGVPPQLSIAVGGVQVAVCEHAVFPAPVVTVWLLGQLLNTGAVLSTTVMVNVQVVVLPAASVAV